MSKPFAFITRAVVVATSILAMNACAADVSTPRKQQALIDKAAFAVQSAFIDSKSNLHTVQLLRDAKAIVICPDVTKMSLVFGGTGGTCVLMGRGANNSWSDPAFYHLSAGSFGLQAGYQHSQLFLIITSHKAVLSMMDHEYTFDASADAGFGPHATNATNDHREVYALQKSNGVFAGVSLGSSKLKPNNAANRAYYGQVVGPEDIVINMRVNNKAADPLRRMMMKAVAR
ncbi:hypothetical protein BG621_07120 [Parasaccharibacter apium]|nr:hypothetical protein BG621_07120 [Parasaccharibacter apium]